MRRMMVSLLMVTLLVGVSTVLARSSDNYCLDWFTLLAGGGGGPAGSAHYAVNLTVGQTAIGAADSANFATGLGYWYGAVGEYRIYLPLILKNHS